MSYLAGMDSIVVLIAALAAPASLSASTIAAAVEHSATASAARRSESGAQATARVTARIISQSARIGSAYAAPQALMVPRLTAVAAVDGRMVPALVYDFE
ncbi:MAG: hypothetical protein LH465_06625 [Sphingomonas bacterium]|nr:hypothetical protein [Sphingomonas bacterium]